MENKFRVEVVYATIDRVLQEIRTRAKEINMFLFIWNWNPSIDDANFTASKAVQLSRLYQMT